jgi:hypothetical protein
VSAGLPDRAEARADINTGILEHQLLSVGT